MADYKLYCMNGLGKLGYVEHLAARDDQEAMRLAREKKLPVECEVWDGKRLVGQVPAHSPE